MRRSRLPLTAIRAFEAAGRHQSFKLAAEELAVSEAAVSRQVRDLEQIVGTPLFHREHRAVRLSEIGLRMLSDLTRSLDLADAALATAMAESSRQEVLVSVEPTFATLLLVPRLLSFSKAWPGIDVKMDVSASLVDLRAKGSGLAIRHSLTGVQSPHWQARHLFDVNLTPLVAPGIKPTCLCDPSELQHIALLRDETDGVWAQWLASVGCDKPMLWGPIFSNAAIAIQSAEHRQGAALGSRLMARHLIRAQSLNDPFEQETPHGAYWLLAGDFQMLTNAEATFCTWLDVEMDKLQKMDADSSFADC